MNIFTPRPILAITLFTVSCAAFAVAQGVITTGGKSFKLPSGAQLGTTNEVHISSRAQVSGGLLHQTEWWVSKEVIERQPHWDGFATEPPLSVPKACALALPDIKQRFPSVHDWLVMTVYIRNQAGVYKSTESHPNIWAYEITFLPADQAMRDKFDPGLRNKYPDYDSP